MLEYRTLSENEICRELFSSFIRRQEVTKCRRFENGKWTVKDAPFIDDWSESDYSALVEDLKSCVRDGGFVFAAFDSSALKGFVSVNAGFFGGGHKYMDMAELHVSEDMRGRGIGSFLFLAAKRWAKQQGAGKIYISAHSAVETQAFYAKMGCVEAELYSQKHIKKEPFDCQLELKIG